MTLENQHQAKTLTYKTRINKRKKMMMEIDYKRRKKESKAKDLHEKKIAADKAIISKLCKLAGNNGSFDETIVSQCSL